MVLQGYQASRETELENSVEEDSVFFCETLLSHQIPIQHATNMQNRFMLPPAMSGQGHHDPPTSLCLGSLSTRSPHAEILEEGGGTEVALTDFHSLL